MPFGGMYGFLGDYAVLWLMLFSLVVHTWCFFRFFPRTRPRLRLIAGNVLVFLCLVGAVAMGAETYLRFLCVRTDSFGVSLPARKWFALHVQLNSWKCRDPEWSEAKPPGVTRIAFVGDSFTYGWGIERTEDRFPDLLAARLQKMAPGRFEVMNVAFPGWGTGDQLTPTADILARFGVDEVILGYVFNDLEKLLPREPGFNPTRPPETKWFNPDSSALVDWMFRTLVLPRVPTVRSYHDWLADGYADERTWSQHGGQLLALRDLCRERGARFRVALLPYLRVGGERFDRDALHRRMREFLAENGVEVADLLDVVRGQDPRTLVVNSLDAHPNEAAHRAFAEAIWTKFFSPREGP